ncbi:MAG: hypothetical protein ACTHMF_05725, partial [Leifsonia sp.]|uniref:hypothetical protein n=1 Tax=Leifsonia sp. TaxID=1870902 RepID=UPI003F7D395E
MLPRFTVGSAAWAGSLDWMAGPSATAPAARPPASTTAIERRARCAGRRRRPRVPCARATAGRAAWSRVRAQRVSRDTG